MGTVPDELLKAEVKRNWEDLHEGEKIERLMSVVTQLWNRVRVLQHEHNELLHHTHNALGEIRVERRIGEYPESALREDRQAHNPFHSKELQYQGEEELPF